MPTKTKTKTKQNFILNWSSLGPLNLISVTCENKLCKLLNQFIYSIKATKQHQGGGVRGQQYM